MVLLGGTATFTLHVWYGSFSVIETAPPPPPRATQRGPRRGKNPHSAVTAPMTPATGDCGKDKDWVEMTAAEQRAAAELGYDALSWDAGGAPEACNFRWMQLSPAEQRAALLLGYTAESWDVRTTPLKVPEQCTNPTPRVS